jgi:hypothetical protein
MYYIIGVFDCGCEYDASFGSLEIVECKTKVEGQDIIRRMNRHSANYQCHGREAMYTLVFDGKIEEMTNIITKPKSIEEKNLFNYKSYCNAWEKQGKENRKMEREMRKAEKETTKIGTKYIS